MHRRRAEFAQRFIVYQNAEMLLLLSGKIENNYFPVLVLEGRDIGREKNPAAGMLRRSPIFIKQHLRNYIKINSKVSFRSAASAFAMTSNFEVNF